ncbi:MAG TPA: arginase family protein [Burkholderiaceae bacterium]|nr:arginase family protein [Burkholderiaceae bacterium]
MTDLETLTALLRPAGGGIYTVSTGRAEQRALQLRLYGAGDEAGIGERWRDALARVATARVAIVAVPSDTGAGLVRGAAFGPGALRAALLDRIPDFTERAARAGIVDVGDVFVVPQLLHDEMLSQQQIDATRAAIHPQLEAEARMQLPVSPLSAAQEVVSRLLAINPALKIFALGGDHSITWPVIAALAARRGRPFAIVHPDAHTDLLPARLGVKYCFATWAYHANEAIGRSQRLVQLGVRASGRPRAHWESTLGVKQFWADEIAVRGEAGALDDIVAHVRGLGVDGVYLSNDIDGTDGAVAPATGAPEGGGLSVAFMRDLIQRLGSETSLIGADLVEVAPTVGAPEGARRTVEVGAAYVADSLAALLDPPERTAFAAPGG